MLDWLRETICDEYHYSYREFYAMAKTYGISAVVKEGRNVRVIFDDEEETVVPYKHIVKYIQESESLEFDIDEELLEKIKKDLKEVKIDE